MSRTSSGVARAIFSSGAVRFGDFTLASGKKSPYYIDLSRLLTSPSDLGSFVKEAGTLAREACDKAGVDALASIELRGALLLSAISSYTGRPCFVIRKTAKSYGVTGRIVGGDIVSGQKFILFDDVVTDGQSKMDSIMTLEEVGAKVNSVFVVVDREQGGRENLSRKGYNLYSILTVSQLTEELSHQGLIDENTRGLVSRYLKSERDVISHSTA